MTSKRSIILTVLVCLQACMSDAQSADAFPPTAINSQTLRVQEKAEELFSRQNYERAHFIYQNELAPIGDKYAHYMLGFMHLTGKGVTQDRVAASAWYRLAAERGTKEFARARDELMTSLSVEQTLKSDQLFIELRKQFGDLILLMNAVRDDYEQLRKRTGSRLSADVSPITVIGISGSSPGDAGADYYPRIERRIKARLEYIGKFAEIEIVDLDMEASELATLADKLDEYLATLDQTD